MHVVRAVIVQHSRDYLSLWRDPAGSAARECLLFEVFLLARESLSQKRRKLAKVDLQRIEGLLQPTSWRHNPNPDPPQDARQAVSWEGTTSVS